MSPSQRTIGEMVRLACTWEVLARKAGNVCPGHEFPDLTVDDFLKSAAAIAPVLDQAPHQPLGVTILRCIEETRKVVNTNTNLGIVLLLAPLASVPLDEPGFWDDAKKLVAATTVEDSRLVYAAIRLANPGGLGKVSDQDIRNEPTLPLIEIMRLASGRDRIAKMFLHLRSQFRGLCRDVVIHQIEKHQNVERGIVESQIQLMSHMEDSLVLRKLGTDRAIDVIRAARRIHQLGGLDSPDGRRAYLDFDAFLRSDNHARNPGTTADLIAAALFVALREGRISPSMPFVWEEHPFGEPGA